jgi:hypothetical protein
MYIYTHTHVHTYITWTCAGVVGLTTTPIPRLDTLTRHTLLEGGESAGGERAVGAGVGVGVGVGGGKRDSSSKLSATLAATLAAASSACGGFNGLEKASSAVDWRRPSSDVNGLEEASSAVPPALQLLIDSLSPGKGAKSVAKKPSGKEPRTSGKGKKKQMQEIGATVSAVSAPPPGAEGGEGGGKGKGGGGRKRAAADLVASGVGGAGGEGGTLNPDKLNPKPAKAPRVSKAGAKKGVVAGLVTGHSGPQDAEPPTQQGVRDHVRDTDPPPPAPPPNTGLKPEKARLKFSKVCKKKTISKVCV